MASNHYRISSYIYVFDSMQGTVGVLNLFGPDKRHRVMVSFVADTEPVPPPVIRPDREFAACSFRVGAFPWLLDMLRNEDPVSVTIADDAPGSVLVQTSVEPAGIGDETGTDSRPA
jgi:hypothetical protein